MVDVHVFAKKDSVVKLLTRPEILCSFLHQKHVQPLVGRRQTHPHGLESVGAKYCLTDCRWHLSAFQPARHFHEIACDTSLHCRTVQLAEYTAPIPLDKFVAVRRVLPVLSNVSEDDCQRDDL